MKIALFDDEFRGEYIKEFLELSGFETDWISDPNSNWDSSIDSYDLIIIDIMMSLKKDSKFLCEHFNNDQGLRTGLHILVYIRDVLKLKSPQTRIILYSARNEEIIKEVLGTRKTYYDKYSRKQDDDEPFIATIKEFMTVDSTI